jgi:rSAM/selenodomain-associated transferase 2
MKMVTLSVIIPTLNEETHLRRTLQSVLTEEVEVIVVDGGSQDRTCQIAEEMGAVVLHSPPGRSAQMNMGATHACGDILFFVHADTLLPENYGSEVQRILARSDVVLGAFSLRLVGKQRGLGLISWGANLRTKWFGLPYGDQGLFLSREMFTAVGGYPQTPIMEDFRLVQSLGKRGRFCLSPQVVKSSGRRWDKRGLLYPTLINQLIIFGFLLGLSPHRLAKIYGVRPNV